MRQVDIDELVGCVFVSERGFCLASNSTSIGVKAIVAGASGAARFIIVSQKMR